MTRLLIISTLRAIAVFLIVTVATYAMMFANPEGIARNVLGIRATNAQVEAEVGRLGLDRPLPAQYVDWLTGLFAGDLGTSYFTSQPVSETIGTRLPVTLALVLLTLLITIVLSIWLGVVAAVRGGWVDRVLQTLAITGAAVPSFIVAIGLVFGLAIAVPLFPATGYVSPDVSLGGWASSLALPVTAILVGSVASAATQFRGAVRDVLRRDFVRTLRARGIPERTVIYRHVLRNAGTPGLTVLSLQTIALLGGVIIIEQVFALPGIGVLANSAAQSGDIPVVMACVAVSVVFVSVVNLVSDVVNARLNPKVRVS